MRIAIIGPGAVGCLLGATLRRGGLDVVLVAPDAETGRALERDGISVEGIRGEYRIAVPATADARVAAPADLVVVAVKAYDTETAVRQHAALAADDAVFVTFQNGLGNIEAIARVVGDGRALGGTTTLGTHLVAPGRVRHAGEGDTFVGEPRGGSSARAERIAVALTAAGLATRAVDDVPARLWSKLAVNAGINALTALLRVPNGALDSDPDAAAVLEAAARETAAVALARGVALDPDEAAARTRAVARRTGANRSSMLVDVSSGRRTEIDAINGEVARLGRESGVPVPVNDALARMVRALERFAPRPAPT